MTMPRHYLCHRAASPIKMDGKLDDPAWKNAAWTEDFGDIQGAKLPKPPLRTRAKMLWDDQYLYIGAELEEPHVWANLTQHDSVIFQDNDFEVFIDPDNDNHNYYEIEINALNTEWDLRLVKPYRDGGPALNEWEMPGFKSAVHVDGTLNDPRDMDKGWSVELALPWKALAEFSKVPSPPRDGDQWRINFSRVEWRTTVEDGKYVKVPKRPEDNWVWSPQGVIDMHQPEHWGYVQFTTTKPGAAHFTPEPTEPARQLLHVIYHAQRNFYETNKRWAVSLLELRLHINAKLEMTPEGYVASIHVGGKRVRIRQDSLVWVD